jgi:transposase
MIDDMIPANHPVRIIWGYVESLDFSSFYGEIRAVQGGPGRPATDPRLLFGLWLFATTEAVGSARELAELCTRDLPYIWLCGGVSVNHHTLADFRSENEEKFRGLLKRHMVSLLATGEVQMEHVVQDGVRVRGHAGAASFRRRGELEKLKADVERQVEALSTEVDRQPKASRTRKEAAAARAKKEQDDRREAAIKRAKETDEAQVAAKKKKSKASGEQRQKAADEGTTRASTTDADATKMKMADGGFRPAFNGQAAMDPDSGYLIAVEVTTSGSDGAALPPMAELIEESYGTPPSSISADGGFATVDAIVKLAKKNITAYVPTRTQKSTKPDAPEIAAWRERMETPKAKENYEKRKRIEWSFARMRNWGMSQFVVRGLKRVSSSFLLYVLTHNYVNHIRRSALAA